MSLEISNRRLNVLAVESRARMRCDVTRHGHAASAPHVHTESDDSTT